MDDDAAGVSFGNGVGRRTLTAEALQQFTEPDHIRNQAAILGQPSRILADKLAEVAGSPGSDPALQNPLRLVCGRKARLVVPHGKMRDAPFQFSRLDAALEARGRQVVSRSSPLEPSADVAPMGASGK